MFDFYLKKVRQELFIRGVWGRATRRITEELTDHYRSDVEGRLNEGESPALAEQLALRTLGDAKQVAEFAAENIRSQSLLTRCPWLVAGGGVFLVGFLGALILLEICSYGMIALVDHYKSIHSSGPTWVLQFIAAVDNWLPFVVGCTWLAWWSRRSPGSWKALVLASIAMGLVSSTSWLTVIPPMDGPHSGHITFAVNSWLAFLCQLICWVSPTIQQEYFGKGLWYNMVNYRLLLAILPVGAVLVLRYMTPRLQRIYS